MPKHKGRLIWLTTDVKVYLIYDLLLIPEWVKNARICPKGHRYGWEKGEDPGCWECKNNQSYSNLPLELTVTSGKKKDHF
jgi:hypothetical protein